MVDNLYNISCKNCNINVNLKEGRIEGRGVIMPGTIRIYYCENCQELYNAFVEEHKIYDDKKENIRDCGQKGKLVEPPKNMSVHNKEKTRGITNCPKCNRASLCWLILETHYVCEVFTNIEPGSLDILKKINRL